MIKKNKLLSEAGFLFAATIIVNAGNFAINLLLGRFLGPQEFAEANIMATLVLVISFIALGFQLTTAKFIAEYNAQEEEYKLVSFMIWLRKKSLWFSAFAVVGLLLLSTFISDFLNFQRSYSLVILFLAVPFYIHMSLSRGYFQGVSSFRKLAFTYLAEMAGRLIFTTILVYIVLAYDLAYATEAVALGFIASFVCAFIIGLQAKVKKDVPIVHFEKKAIYYFIAVVEIYELSQILINNSDVVLVKHFFENMEAGLYASLALIGRVVFFATWTIVTLLFPKVIEKEKKGEDHSYLFWISLSIVGGFGIGIITSCYFLDELIIHILFGEAYLSIAPLLWQYAIATTLFSCANVFVYYHMSLSNYFPVAISVLAGVLQIVLIYFLHESISQVIMVQILLMAGLVCTLIGFHLFISFKKKSIKPIHYDLKYD